MYTNIRENSNWVNRSPNVDWVVFAIADNGDRDLLDDLVSNCLDKNVSYTCSAGQLASVTEWLFDIGIVNSACPKTPLKKNYKFPQPILFFFIFFVEKVLLLLYVKK